MTVAGVDAREPRLPLVGAPPEWVTWREFASPDRPAVATADSPAAPSVVASLDRRQSADGRAVGAIGFVRGPSEGPGLRSVLLAAEHWLAERGAQVVRCPVQLSTWHGHRAVVDLFPEDGGEPAFPLEPVNGPGLPRLLQASGYRPAHRAVSWLVPIGAWLETVGPAVERTWRSGLTHRPIDSAHPDRDLAAIHAVAGRAFRASWGFSPISADEFAALYLPRLRSMPVDLTRVLVDRPGDPVGFVFAYPDPATHPSEPGARIVVKSVAVLPEVSRGVPGCGIALAAVVHAAALDLGYRSAVHALEAEGGHTQRVSARAGRLMRRYATFEKRLGGPGAPGAP